MLSTLALSTCAVCVLLLLKLEHKQNSEVTRALWLPTMWILLIASKPLGTWFPVYGTSDVESGSSLDRIAIIIMICISLFILFRRRFNWALAFRENFWLTLLLSYMLVSILWSDLPFLSFRRWTRELPTILMAFVVLTEQSPRRAIECLLRRTTYILIPFSILLIKYFPEFGVQFSRWSGERSWIGVAQQKNSLGRLCFISAFFLIWSLLRRKRVKGPLAWKYEPHVEILILALSLYMIKGPGMTSYSATSIIVLIIGLMSYFGFHKLKNAGMTIKPGLPIIIVTICIFLGTAAVFTKGNTISSVAASAGRDTTLTGRTDIWAWLLPIAMQHPLLGGGFGSFWTTRTIEVFRIRSAHSGYLDVLLGTGFIGLLLVTMFLLSGCGKASRRDSCDYDWDAMFMCYIIMCVLHNMTESSINNFSNQLTAIIAFLYVSYTRITPRS